MTNNDWAKLLDTSDEWITARTGIKRRHMAPDDMSTADLAVLAARKALDRAGMTADVLHEIIVASDTPEVYLPDTASFVQHRLGAPEIPAYDLAGSGCAGFIQALSIARSRVHTEAGPILVIGVELLTRLMNWKDRNTAVLFGDGAGAAIVDRTPGPGAILATCEGTDGSKAHILGLEVGGTRRPFSAREALDPAYPPVVMKGKEVFREAVLRMSEASRAVLKKAQLGIDDIALVIPHQANVRIIHAVAAEVGIPLERVLINVDEYGNTGSASVAIGLDQALRSSRLAAGALVLLTAFGAGFHWAAAIIRV